MLALEPLRNCKDEIKKGDEEMGSFSMGDDDFTTGNLLDDIDFDDLFAGIDYGDVLPDLEIDPDNLLAEFSISTTTASGGGGEEYNSELNGSVSSEKLLVLQDHEFNEKRDDDRGSGTGSGSGLSSSSSRGEEIVSKQTDINDQSGGVVNKAPNLNSNKETTSRGGRKSSSSSSSGQKGSQGKRKVKVDWTPELHRRFVQAVEQLGMDKAVPSRILELMGIDCLTRHNIASHLQKYRSHQKHLLAREAEAASWSQRRQIYGSTGGRGNKREVLISSSNNTSTTTTPTPWIAPTMGFPPPPPPPHHPHPPNLLHHGHHFRPLHVWGHPTVDPHHQSASMHMWPKHLVHSPSQRPRWAPPPPPPPPDPSYWHNHPNHQRVVTPGTPCFSTQPLGTPRISSAPLVPGIPPPHHAMYKVDHGMGVVPTHQNGQQSDSHSSSTPFDLHPTKERIDAAIGDVLSKPWLPLPLGLKPPLLDSVLVELQRQGIPKIPPTTCA